MSEASEVVSLVRAQFRNRLMHNMTATLHSRLEVTWVVCVVCIIDVRVLVVISFIRKQGKVLRVTYHGDRLVRHGCNTTKGERRSFFLPFYTK